MSKVLRKRISDELAKKYKNEKSFFLVNYQGLSANQTTELRRELRADQVRMNVVKNSVARHTFEKLGYKDFNEVLTGMNAIVYGSDPVAAAKRLLAYKEKNQKPEVRGAVVEGKFLKADEVVALSKLPGREQLLSQILGAFQGVAQQFVSTLNEIPRKFVGTLQAVADKEKK